MAPLQDPQAPSPTLHFFCGKMAAGKSTLAAQIAHQNGAVLISEDTWLADLYPEEITTLDHYVTYSRRVRAVVGPHVKALLTLGMSVVLDFPGNTPRQRAWFREIFEGVGVPHVLHYVQASDRRCLDQLVIRNRDRPAGAAFTSEDEFRAVTAHFSPPRPDEGFHVQEHGKE